MYFSTKVNMQELYDKVRSWYNKSQKLTRLCIFPFIDVVLQSLPLHYAYKLYRVFDFVYPDACYSRRFEINAQFKMRPYLIEDNPRVLLEYVDGLVLRDELNTSAQNDIWNDLARNAFVNSFRSALIQSNLNNERVHWKHVLHCALAGGNLEIVQLCIERAKIDDFTLTSFIHHVYSCPTTTYDLIFRRSIFEWFYDNIVNSNARCVEKYFALHRILLTVEHIHKETLWQSCPYADDEPYPSIIRKSKNTLWYVKTNHDETQLLTIHIGKCFATYKVRHIYENKSADELVKLPLSFFN